MYLTLAAASTGIAIGWVDSRSTEVQVPALLIILAAGALGALWPKGSWFLGIVVGLGVPCFNAFSQSRGWRTPYPSAPGSIWILPVLFGLAAAGFGALIRWGMGQMSEGAAGS